MFFNKQVEYEVDFGCKFELFEHVIQVVVYPNFLKFNNRKLQTWCFPFFSSEPARTI